MAMPWEDSVRNRNPKQLTLFVAPSEQAVAPRVRRRAENTFNHLSQVHRLGVTMTAPADATGRSPMARAAPTCSSTRARAILPTRPSASFVVKNFSGRDMHGKTLLVVRQPGAHPQGLRVRARDADGDGAMQVGRDKFKDIQREAGHGIKHFIMTHELIHVCGLDNSEHTIYGPDADLFIQQPQPFQALSTSLTRTSSCSTFRQARGRAWPRRRSS